MPNLYRQCIITGNCPTDVRNKVEQNTLADKILKYGSGAVFFGGLGISSATEAAEATESVGTGITVGREIPLRPFRPHGPLDKIGIESIGPRETPFGAPPRAPVEVEVGVGRVEPSDPSVITPVEAPPAVIDEVINIPVTETTTVGGDILGGDTSAIIEVTPRAPNNEVVSRTQYNNPSFEVSLFHNSPAGELSATDQITVSGGGGTVVGDTSLAPGNWEEISLVDFTGVSRNAQTGEEETSFFTSTPEGARPRGRFSARQRPGLYSRGTEQVQIQDLDFIGRPGRLVEFDYTNPDLNAEISEIFERDVAAAEAAPSSLFQDIVRLGRLQVNRARSGLVRASRIGQRASMQTRSGLRVGARTHFYLDISPITPADAEEIPLGEFSGSGSVVDMQAEGEVLEEDLMDTYEESEGIGSNVQLIIDEPLEDASINEVVVDVPYNPRRPPQTYPGIDFSGLSIQHDNTSSAIPIDIIPGYRPDDIVIVSEDYYLHPSLYKRRKRRRKYIFVY